MELAAFSPIPRRPDHLGKQLMITDLLVKAENATTLSEYLTLTVGKYIKLVVQLKVFHYYFFIFFFKQKHACRIMLKENVKN